MRNLEVILNDRRVKKVYKNVDNGIVFKLKLDVHTYKGSDNALVSFTRILGWEHLCVSFKNKIPSWEVMNEMKEMFFEDNEDAFQYHPVKDNYINNNEYCLHIWRPLETNIPEPPSILVGFRDGHIDEDLQRAKELHEFIGSPLTDEELKMLYLSSSKEGQKQLSNDIKNMSQNDLLKLCAKIGIL